MSDEYKPRDIYWCESCDEEHCNNCNPKMTDVNGVTLCPKCYENLEDFDEDEAFSASFPDEELEDNLDE